MCEHNPDIFLLVIILLVVVVLLILYLLTEKACLTWKIRPG